LQERETRGGGDGEMGGGMMKRVGDGETGERGWMGDKR